MVIRLACERDMVHNRSMTLQRVTVSITDDRLSDTESIYTSTLSLRQELLEIDGIRDLVPSASDVNPQAKSGFATLIGVLSISVPATLPVLREFRMLLRDWLHRNDGKRIAIEVNGTKIDANGLSDAEFLELLSSEKISTDDGAQTNQ